MSILKIKKNGQWEEIVGTLNEVKTISLTGDATGSGSFNSNGSVTIPTTVVKATKDGNGNVISDTYATKAELNTKASYTTGSTAQNRAGKNAVYDVAGQLYYEDKIILESKHFTFTMNNWQYDVWVDVYSNNRAHWYGYTKNPSAITLSQIGSSGIYRLSTGAMFSGLYLCNTPSSAALKLNVDGYIYKPENVTGTFYSSDALGTGWGTVGAYTGVFNATQATLYAASSSIAASSILRFDAIGTYTLVS